MIWMTIKKYWNIASLLLASLGTFLLTFFGTQYFKSRKERKRLEAQADHMIDVLEGDKKIDRQRKSRSAEIANDIEKRRDELRNPNDWD